MAAPISNNTLFYGDNLAILRQYIPSNSIDLVYLDPPFNSDRDYNVLFKDESGNASEAQILAFEDTWRWGPEAAQEYHEVVTTGPTQVSQVLGSLRSFLGENQLMAYLVMMTSRLVELHRVLKPTGTLWLHCDPTASHYLKLILDSIFGREHFLNEVIWHYTGGGRSKKYFSKKHDVLFWYKRGKTYTFNIDAVRVPYKETSGYAKGGITSSSGKHYSPNPLGTPVDDVWELPIINPNSPERLGYPTQKPLNLLERILEASSNPEDLVLDPFCGCGTTIAAAQKLNRRWIGIDITHLSISLQKYRLEQMFPGITFKVVGEPQDIAAAYQLATENRYQFQWWALSLIHARPVGSETGGRSGKKGSDKGIDGMIIFIDDNTGKPKIVLVQVKSGKVKSGDIRDLRGTIEREGAALGVFLTLEPPSRDMVAEASSAGFYHSPGWGRDYPRLQLLTIEQLLHGAEVMMPPAYGTFKQAQRAEPSEGDQLGFSLD